MIITYIKKKNSLIYNLFIKYLAKLNILKINKTIEIKIDNLFYDFMIPGAGANCSTHNNI